VGGSISICHHLFLGLHCRMQDSGRGFQAVGTFSMLPMLTE